MLQWLRVCYTNFRIRFCHSRLPILRPLSPVLPLYSWSLVSQIMGKSKGGFYAVARGRSVGIFSTWDECKAQVDGFPNARYKKFATPSEAETFIAENSGSKGTSNAATTGVPKPVVAAKTTADLSGTKFDRKYSGKPRTVNSSRTILLDQALPRPVISASGTSGQQQRSFSTTQVLDKRKLKVTEERVVNKRLKTDASVANPGINIKDFTVDEDGYVVVYTDGACTQNGKRGARAGIGVWFGDNHAMNVSEPVKGRQTNNTAEIQAAERAILQAKARGINKLNVKTDSQFTINCVTKWMDKWKRNNWKLVDGKPVINRPELEKLDAAMSGMEIKWSYIAGHKGHYGNEAADRLAVAGAEKS